MRLLILCLILLLLVGSASARSPRGTPLGATLTASATPSPTSIVATWTTGGASDSRMGCGTTFGVYDHLAVMNGVAQTSVTSHFAIVAGLLPSTTYYCQVLSGAAFGNFTQATNAAPTLTPLTGVTIGTATQPHVNQVNGDFFSNCVSNNGATYLTTDDHHGWNTGGASSANMSVNTMNTSTLTGTNGNLLSGFGGFNTDNGDGKSSKAISMACRDGNLYILYSRLNITGGAGPFTYGSFLKSPDHGSTWANEQAPTSFTANGVLPSLTYTPFVNSSIGASCSFMTYGPDDGSLGYPDNIDAYAYLICNDGVYSGTTDRLYLIRIPWQALVSLDGTQIQYYIGGSTGNGIDGSLDGAWSYSATSIAVLYTTPGNTLLGVPVLVWMRNSGGYALLDAWDTVNGNPSSTTLQIWYSAHPWSIPTLISGPTAISPQAFYEQVPRMFDMGSATCNGSGTGMAMHFWTSGNYLDNTYYAFWDQPMSFIC